MHILAITDAEHPGLRPDDAPLADAFTALGCEVSAQPWGVSVDPGAVDLVVIRTPWDYFERAPEFLSWLDALPVPVANPRDVVRWNVDKFYLGELEQQGLAKIPATRFLAADERPTDGSALLDALGAERGVIKPAISGGAFRTRVVRHGETVEWTDDDRGAFVVQAFVPAIETRGEWSLMVFGGKHSHAVLKRAAAGDFRVQTDHGGTVHGDPPPANFIALAETLVHEVSAFHGLAGPLPYARVDFVETDEGDALLMELELIEPELFFRADPSSPARFAKALTDYEGTALDRRS